MQTTALSTADTDRKLLAGERLTPAEIAHIHQLDAVAQTALAAKAGRSAGAATRNVNQAAPMQTAIAKAAALASLFDVKPCHRVREVRKVIQELTPARFGLLAVPERKTVKKVIDAIIDDE